MDSPESPVDAAQLNDGCWPGKAGAIGLVAVRIEGRPRSLCEVVLILRGCSIDQRRTDGFRERTSSVLSRSCAQALEWSRTTVTVLDNDQAFHEVLLIEALHRVMSRSSRCVSCVS
jgi:hypothetical protein